ncbi:MAG TPA: DNA-processing protein DprA [Gemmatimonadales bacterium]|nr:DNA-processing protein DprA [Gemmatimonadales bacterium]
MDRQRLAYLALTQVPGLGPARLKTLLDACHTPLGAHSAPFAFLCRLPDMPLDCATAIKAMPLAAGRHLVEACERIGARILIPDDPEFPQALRVIPDPPPVLFAMGDLGLLQRPAVAIVGSRDHSAYGQTVARATAALAARAGLAVVSGMARGLDAVAHASALDANGATIGVLGNGLGVIYPAANRALYERVLRHGLLLSEFPPGERPHAGSFPRRNRLISGLARVTLVVEAAIGSGALITVDTALKQGRDVMAVPGPITSALSTGCNRLLRDGATPYLEPADLAQLFPDIVFPAEQPRDPSTGPKPLPDSLSRAERNVAQALGLEPLSVDTLVQRVGGPVGQLLAVLCSLEVQGVVEQRAGRMFRRL